MSTADLRYDKRVFVMLLIIVGVITYISLFPFHFRRPPSLEGPLHTLIKTWNIVPSRGNLIGNTLLYVPLGFLAVLIHRARQAQNVRLFLAILSGFVLSVVLELLQFYDRGRITHLADVYANTVGSALGALCARAFSTDSRWQYIRELEAKPLPALLLITWLANRLFPYVPTLDIHKYWNALRPLFLTPTLSVSDIVRYGVMWLVVCVLLETIIGQQRSRTAFPILVGFVLGAKILIVNKVLIPAEVLAAWLTFALWLMLLRYGPKVWYVVTAICLGALIIASRLEPFDFASPARPFGWVPFRSFLQGSLSLNIQSFLEKSFSYGSLLWLLTQIGFPLRYAAALIAGGLLLISLIQVYLPGRSAESTDAIIVLLIAWILSLLAERSSKDAVSSRV